MITQAFLRGAVVFVLAGLLTFVLSKRSAAVRHNIWASSLIIQLAVLAFIPVLPPITLPVLPTLSVTIDEPVPEATQERRNEETKKRNSNPGAPATSNPRPNDTRPSQLPAHAPAPAPVSWQHLLIYAYLTGAALVFLRYLLGTLLMMHLANKGTRVDQGNWLTLAQRIANEMGIKRPITLLWGDKLAVPITWGILYPMILLPESANEWTLERRRFVLVHEMAHVRRFDALTQFVAQITLAVFWFSPFVWLAEWRLRVEREHACDDVVLHHGTEATLYADELLQMVRSLMSRRAARPAFAALAMARRSEFEGRMLAILDPERRRSVSGIGSAFAFIVMSLLLAMPVAALNPVAFNAEITKSRNHEITKPPAAPVASARVAQPCDYQVTKTHSSISATVSGEQFWHIYVRIEEPGRCLLGTVDGPFALTDDESAVQELGANGIITLREVTAAKDVAVDISPKAGGGLHTSVENTGSGTMTTELLHQWIGRMLPLVMREAGYRPQERVERMLASHGLKGTLETIESFYSPGSRTTHYIDLIKEKRWTDSQLVQIWGSAVKSLEKSPVDLARVKEAIPGNKTEWTQLQHAPEWLEQTLATFKSDGEVHNVLKAHVSGADKPTLLMLARAAQRMQSGYEKSSYLVEASSFMLTTRDKQLEDAWFAVALTIGSSYEQKTALLAAMSFARGNPRLQDMIAQVALTMSSDLDKTAVLQALAAVR